MIETNRSLLITVFFKREFVPVTFEFMNLRQYPCNNSRILAKDIQVHVHANNVSELESLLCLAIRLSKLSRVGNYWFL